MTREARKLSMRSDDSAYRSVEKETTSGRSSSQSHTSSSPIGDCGGYIEKTKSLSKKKKSKKLGDSEINVQLEGIYYSGVLYFFRCIFESNYSIILKVDYKKPLGFSVTKTSNGQPIAFEPVCTKEKNLQTIFFNYDTIVDFSIGIQENLKHFFSQPKANESLNISNENLKAEIEGKVATFN